MEIADPHPAWLQEWMRLQDLAARRYGQIVGHAQVPINVEALDRQSNERLGLITKTPPATPAGAAAQLELLRTIYSVHQATNDRVFSACLESVISFLRRAESLPEH